MKTWLEEIEMFGRFPYGTLCMPKPTSLATNYGWWDPNPA